MFTSLLLANAVLPAMAMSPDTAAPRFPDSLEGLEHTYRAEAALEGYALDPTNRAVSRLFYRTIFASSSGQASGWNGNLASCNAGDTTADFKGAVQRRINWFRAMAGIPAAVSLDATFSANAQQAAMIMAANKSLSHTPPTTWLCYNSTGATAAGKSNIALGRFGPDAVANGYMGDGGSNNAAVGHRRWVLYPQTQFMGTGDVDGSIAGTSSNSLWVFDANYSAKRPAVRDDFVAWPPKGYVPYNAVYPRWSFAYPGADFSAATVSMTANGAAMGTTLEQIANGYGENTVVWYPAGISDGMSWPRPAADTVYGVTVSNVKVGGVARSFSYTVTVFDPDQAGQGDVTQNIAGSASASAGIASRYTFDAVPGATAYQWRQLQISPYSLSDGAENGSGNFTVSTTGGYPVVQSDAVASGSNSFHLAHVQGNDQTLTLKQPLLVGGGGALAYSSRLGYAGPGQQALVEVSQDDGASWVALSLQAGSGGAGESSFTTRTISLAPYAGRTVQLRFRYAMTGGSFYFQSSKGVGWYIDNIALAGVEAAGTAGSPTTVADTSFDFTPGQSGDVLLQVRPGMYNYFGDWSPTKRVAVGTGGAVVSDADRLMNWAERQYPQYFSPAASSQQIAGYTARAYGGGVYLGVLSGEVYVYGPPFGNKVLDVGPLSTFLANCGC
ncbi:CAP domain-containing protein [Chitinimonas sp.]|uniref:CAP domain-containing protein n=1 Tax=Chitinimonas sp. TaxID=1934313 RepID=UPI0035B4B6E2